MTKHKIFIINPGSTSTKIALYENDRELFCESIRYSQSELSAFETINDQLTLRFESIRKFLEARHLNVADFSAIAARGGLMKPLSGGTYKISEDMLEDLRSMKFGTHASNLAAPIACELAKPYGIPTFITNPVVVDEFEEISRIAGHPDFKRRSAFHALNQKAVATRYANETNQKYEELNLIVTHLGGGITVGAHKKGRVIDVNNALVEGPFSPERSGTLPTSDLVALCFSAKYTKDEINKILVGKGGLLAYLGTSDCAEIQKNITNGDKNSELILDAMTYQISKEIGAMAAVLEGKVNAIILTGGVAYSSFVTDHIKKRVHFIAPVIIYPGEDEMKALAEGTLSVLEGKSEAQIY